MRLTRRLADSVRSPARFTGLLRRVIEIVRRGELVAMLSRMRPRSPNAAEYRAWRAAQASPSAGSVDARFVIALDLDEDVGRSALAHQLVDALPGAAAMLVRDGALWRRVAQSEARPLADWLTSLEAGWIWWIDRPLRIEPGAARAIGEACSSSTTRVVYADHDLEDRLGRPVQPVFKSAWDIEQIVEHPYPGPLLVVHAELAPYVDAAREPKAGGCWGFLVAATHVLPRDVVVHVPRVLQHVPASSTTFERTVQARRTVSARVIEIATARGDAVDLDPERTPWLRYRTPPDATLSVVIPTRDRSALLERCIESILASGLDASAEIVVVDNGSTDPDVKALLGNLKRRVELTVVSMPVPFNFSQLCNAGVATARNRVVVLLNNDTEVTGDSLRELVSLACRSRVGAVGPLLLYPDRRIQSAGVLLGVNRTATSALAGFDTADPAARSWCAARRQVSAVLGACLAVERSKYLHVGGMDERFAVSHNEVDLCLRLEAAGWTNLFTPFATLIHTEGATRGFEVTRAERDRLGSEEALFMERWGHVAAAVDPAHNPALARVGNAFALCETPVTSPRTGWRHDAPLLAPRHPMLQA